MLIMKNFVFVLALFLGACSVGTSSPTVSPTGWTWMGGSNATNAYGVYGTQGLAAQGNIPGARYIALSWVDQTNNFWMFGGSGNALSGASGNLNDLWKYNTATNQWSWISGSNTINSAGIYGTIQVAATGNIPGGRFGGVSWLDLSGNLWLFGGFGNDESGTVGALNDLWKYNPNTNLWTWMNGAKIVKSPGVYGAQGVANNLNTPGARLGSVSWVDSSGNLWLFGGADDIITANVFNDLWMYNPNTNQWTWVSGARTVNSFGVYGTQGTSSAFNVPGARLDSVSWRDNSGNLWLFGGSGVDGSNIRGDLNDIWQYNIANGLWTWRSGSNMSNQYGVYMAQGIPSLNSIPGSREHRTPISRTNNNGQLWMLGGDGYATSTIGLLNDLWSYNSSTNRWTWVGGSTESAALGTYGSIGITANGNTPGARKDGVGFVDTSGNLWIFGGNGYGASGASGDLNDLWRYNTPLGPGS
jgi:N-acetylneuraminic acid mutarotase